MLDFAADFIASIIELALEPWIDKLSKSGNPEKETSSLRRTSGNKDDNFSD